MDRRRIHACVAGLVILGFAMGTQSWAKLQITKERATIRWHHDLKAAHKIAVATRRPLLVVFGGASCTYCRQFESKTLSDPAVASYVNAQFVPVHLDFEKDRRIADILEIQSLPTSVVLNADADLLGSVVGFINKQECEKFLRAALDTERSLRKNIDGKR